MSIAIGGADITAFVAVCADGVKRADRLWWSRRHYHVLKTSRAKGGKRKDLTPCDAVTP